MKQEPATQERLVEKAVAEVERSKRLKFAKNNGFHAELRRRVDEYFHTSGRRQRDCPQMYLKTMIILACFGPHCGLAGRRSPCLIVPLGS
jgi:hypothetical protein